ncbi:hypothetical protein ACFFMN_06270 [Planobispora siamensis]|uniref:Integrase n=1 Tax=Planobispora siamensis TaxID=936338 RepID=A0A8J3SSD6_9ACTN|nr:hypothetical protein [Planobispora siamensis]GIH97825.1 hypothetical protein Psi01_84550 [Planobispora siamensis]
MSAKAEQAHPEGVGDRITLLAQWAGLGHRTAHGMRAGMATAARAAGHDAVAIAAQGGWKYNSDSLGRYLRLMEGWGEDNALYNIGM